SPAKEDVPVLIDALKPPGPIAYRRAVAQALWWVAVDREDKENIAALLPAMPVLLEAFKEKDAGLRLILAQTFEAIGPAAKDAVPALIEALDDRDEAFRLEAMMALTAMGPEARKAVPRLVELLKSHAAKQKTAAAMCLASVGPEVKEMPEGAEALRVLE